MIVENEFAATTYRVLNKFACEMAPSGAWSWHCVVKNGTRLPLSASFDEGFLQLACRTEAIRKTTLVLDDAILCNKSMAGGVKLTLDPATNFLHLRADIVVLGELQLRNRLEWALEGFHEGHCLLHSSASHNSYQMVQPTPAPIRIWTSCCVTAHGLAQSAR